MTIAITLNLPEELVIEAQKRGLLTEERVTAWLDEALKKEDAYQRLASTVDRLHSANGEVGLSLEEIDAEVQAVRLARKQRSSHE
jgi:hypothetical protein